MARGGRVADVGAHRVVAMLVLKHAFEHDELLAPAVRVRREMASRRVAHDGSGARHLVANAIEHAPLHAGDGRIHPRLLRGVNDDALAEVCVDVHDYPIVDAPLCSAAHAPALAHACAPGA